MSNNPKEDSPSWPNQKEVVDGVTPTEEVPQHPDLFVGKSIDIVMED